MTDRYNAFIVVLDRDIRSDDAQPILDALRMIKGVQQVDPLVADYEAHIARARAQADLTEKILSALQETK